MAAVSSLLLLLATLALTPGTYTSPPFWNDTDPSEGEILPENMKIPETCLLLQLFALMFITISTASNPEFITLSTASRTERNGCGVFDNAPTEVVGGSIAEKGSWPWTAAVFVRRDDGTLAENCGGVLVTDSHVLTAAHCLVTVQPLDPSRVIVRLGYFNLTAQSEPGAIDVEVESVRLHEQFEAWTYKNDIAVLKLRRPVDLGGTISPACLPYESLRGEDLENKEVVSNGYGTTESNGRYSEVLMQTGFYIQSPEVCKKAYEPGVPITETYLCAGAMYGVTHACKGNSGDPLVKRGKDNKYYLLGVMSFGQNCGQPNNPGVYTRVTEYLDWLLQNISH